MYDSKRFLYRYFPPLFRRIEGDRETGRGCHTSKTVGFLLLAILSFIHCSAAQNTSHVVLRWTVTGNDSDYKNWAAAQTFKIGDTLGSGLKMIAAIAGTFIVVAAIAIWCIWCCCRRIWCIRCCCRRIWCIWCCCCCRRIGSIGCCCRRKRNTNYPRNVEASLKECGLSPARYKYKDVKKITNSFKEKIGQGGFGSVFKGKLQDGRIVAVKILSETKGNGNEFINEVVNISKTSHVNIVALLGFCFEGLKRALIYEFMPNGSLEKFIYNEKPLEKKKKKKKNEALETNPHLGWEALHKIAIGIARGLEYLHRGCSTRILHFDIKPHNILLDHDFTPKIADFGLSKQCQARQSVVSMTGARGTPGFTAPELISRSFGGVSHKSDVYSYGMMVLKMVGGRKNIDVRVTNISEIYFPHWIYKRLDLNQDLPLHGLTSLEEKQVAQKMIIVGLWCIQVNPLNRPPMSRVLEMLESSVSELQMPPQPFLSSP